MWKVTTIRRRSAHSSPDRSAHPKAQARERRDCPAQAFGVQSLRSWRIGQAVPGIEMTHRLNDLRLALIALGAVVGILSFGRDATAQSTASTARTAVRTCCSRRICPAGCCAPGKTASPSRTRDQAPSLLTAGLTRTPSSCDCDSDEPASPASRRESAPTGSRSFEHLSEVASHPIPGTSVGLVNRLSEPDSWPPRSPLYLTTARLLI